METIPYERHKILGCENMDKELQGSVRFSDLAYTIKVTLSHQITIPNVLLEQF